MAESKEPAAPTQTTTVARAGVCCLSGVRAPEDVPQLVRMRGSDGHDYLVAKACLDKYSRQLYVYGIAAMARMMNSNVLVSGLSGLGAEIAKNVVLAGVKAFTIHDSKSAEHVDLASNFFLSESDIGKNRAACCVEKLRELNKLTPVSLLSGSLECTAESLGKFTVVVLVDYPRAEIVRINEYCRKNNIIMLAAGTYGLYGYSFSDFGPNHKVSDSDGEPPRSGIIVGIERGKQTKLITDSKERHGLDDGDSVVLNGVGGTGSMSDESGLTWCHALNDKCFSVQRVVDQIPTSETAGDDSTRSSSRSVTNNHAFAIDVDSSSWQDYSGGAFYFNQRKNIKEIQHRSFSDALVCPEETAVAVYDFQDWQRPRKLHALLRALWQFDEVHRNERCPLPGSIEESREVTDGAMKLLVEEGVLADLSVAKRSGDEALREAESNHKETRELLMTIALGSAGQLNPMAAIFGGLVGQEVMKACSGKYLPISQFFHFEDVNVLPRMWKKEEGPPLPENDVKIPQQDGKPSRYDGLVATMGYNFLVKMQESQAFLVGSGALGCELLKNFAVSGLGTSSKLMGEGVTVTDMDTIENSNLCRQFLFREWDVGKEKSVVAAQAANAMNTDFKPKALNIKVAPDTEAKYNDEFWESQVRNGRQSSRSLCVFFRHAQRTPSHIPFSWSVLLSDLLFQSTDHWCSLHPQSILILLLDMPQTLIVNALDNVQARKYVDTRCTFYGKPLLESGTLGVKANVQPIIPHITQCYNDVDDAPPKSIAVCTLKQFPYKVDHTIQWARDHFSKYFEKDPAEVNGYLSGKDKWLSDMQRQNTGYSSLKTVHHMLCGINGLRGTGIISNFEDCVAWARLLFEELFSNNIKQLLAQYPADKMINIGTDEDPKMVKFWRGDKKVCTPANFDADGVNEDHMNFIVAAANLCASVYRVSQASPDERSVDSVRQIVKKVDVPTFHADKSKLIAVTEEQAKEQAENGDAALGIDVEAEFAKLSSDLRAKEKSIGELVKKLTPESFEKDDDTNHHMDFITACSNLRCFNYGIRGPGGSIGADKMKTKKIAGNIIPAIATTTALATGAVMLELFKVVNGRSSIEAYRSYNFNLGTNIFLGFEPTPCTTEDFCGKTFSVWSYIDVNDMTLGGLLVGRP